MINGQALGLFTLYDLFPRNGSLSFLFQCGEESSLARTQDARRNDCFCFWPWAAVCRLEETIPKILPIILFLMDFFYSQNSHLLFLMWPLEYGEYYCIGAALKLLQYPHHDCFCFKCSLPDNVLELNMNGGLQANVLSTHSAKTVNTDTLSSGNPSFWSVRLFCTLDKPFILRKLTNYSRIILYSLSYLLFFFLFQA